MSKLLMSRSIQETRLLASANAREDASEILVLAQEIPSHLRQTHVALWNLVRSGPVDAIQAAGEEFLRQLDETIATLGALVSKNALLASLVDLGVEVERLRQEHLDRWPWFQSQDIEEALAESARGETLELDDAFAQLAGVSREEWLQQVAAHERRNGNQDRK